MRGLIRLRCCRLRLLTATAMLAVAVWFEIPAAHVPAGVALATAWIVGFYRLRGDVGWTLAESSPIRNLFLSATTGHVLVALVAAFGCVAAGLNHWGRRESGKMYGLLAAAATIASLALVFWFGFGRAGDPANATWTLAIYAIAALAVAIRFNRRDVALVGSVLLLATLAQGIVFRWNPAWQLQQPWIVALLAHATLIGVGCIVLRFATIRIKTSSAVDAAGKVELLRAFANSALVTSIVAALWTIATCYSSSATTLSIHAVWLAGVWLILAALLESPVLFTASQIGLVLAIVCGVTALVERHAWYAAAHRPWLDPWFLEAQGIGLAAYCLALSAIRWEIDRRRRTKRRECRCSAARMAGNECRVIRFAVASCGSRRGDRRCCAPGGRGIVCGCPWRRARTFAHRSCRQAGRVADRAVRNRWDRPPSCGRSRRLAAVGGRGHRAVRTVAKVFQRLAANRPGAARDGRMPALGSALGK